MLCTQGLLAYSARTKSIIHPYQLRTACSKQLAIGPVAQHPGIDVPPRINPCRVCLLREKVLTRKKRETYGGRTTLDGKTSLFTSVLCVNQSNSKKKKTPLGNGKGRRVLRAAPTAPRDSADGQLASTSRAAPRASNRVPPRQLMGRSATQRRPPRATTADPNCSRRQLPVGHRQVTAQRQDRRRLKQHVVGRKNRLCRRSNRAFLQDAIFAASSCLYHHRREFPLLACCSVPTAFTVTIGCSFWGRNEFAMARW